MSMANLVCLKLGEEAECTAGWTGRLKNDADQWAGGLAETLGLVDAPAEGTIWVLVEELIEAVDEIYAVRAPGENRVQVMDEWRIGAAYGADCHFELTVGEAGEVTVELAADPNWDGGEISVAVLNQEDVHFGVTVPFVADAVLVQASSVKGARIVATCASLDPGTYMVVASATQPGKAAGGFTVTATSAAELTLAAKLLSDAVVKQRYSYAWKGAAAGGPPVEGDSASWRRNPVFKLTVANPAKVAAVVEHQAAQLGKVGVHIIKNTDPNFSDAVVPNHAVLAHSGYWAGPQAACEATTTEADEVLLVMASVAEKGVTGNYTLHIMSEGPCAVELLPQAEWSIVPEGMWRTAISGGYEMSREEGEEGPPPILSNPHLRLRATEDGKACVVLSRVQVAPLPVPTPPPTPPPKPEGEEGAEGEEAPEEPEPEPEPEPEEEKEPEVPVTHGFWVVKNAEGGSEEYVEEGFEVLQTVDPFVEQGEISLEVDVSASGPPCFVIPALSHPKRVGRYVCSALGAGIEVMLEPTPNTRAAWLAPPTPPPTPPPEPQTEAELVDGEEAPAEGEEPAAEEAPTEEAEAEAAE